LQRERDEAFKKDYPDDHSLDKAMQLCRNLYKKYMNKFGEVHELVSSLRCIDWDLQKYVRRPEFGDAEKHYFRLQIILGGALLRNIQDITTMRSNLHKKLIADGQLRQTSHLHVVEDYFNRELDAIESNGYKLDKRLMEEQRIAITAAVGFSRTYSALYRKTYYLLDEVIGNRFGHGIPTERLERQNYFLSIFDFLNHAEADPDGFVSAYGADHNLSIEAVWRVRETIGRSIRDELRRELEEDMEALTSSHDVGALVRSPETWTQVYHAYLSSATPRWQQQLQGRINFDPAKYFEDFSALMSEPYYSLAGRPSLISFARPTTSED